MKKSKRGGSEIPEAEINLTYNSGRYYVYEGESYVADEENLSEALIWFLSLVSKNVRVEDTKRGTLETYGVTKEHVTP